MNRNRMSAIAIMAIALGMTAATRAADKLPPPDPIALFNPNSLDALAGNLRGYLVRSLPNPLFAKDDGWGQTRYVTRGIEWRGQGLGVRLERQRSHKNDGSWKKIWVTAENPADTLVVDLRDVSHPEPGRMAFGVFVSLDLRVHYEHEEWERGRKLFDASARARLRLKLAVRLEATVRLESSGALLPDAIARLRVTDARLGYDNFVLEHIAGLGGEAAKVLGDAARGGLNRWHPSLERELLERAESTLVKAGDTREVRVNLSALLSRKAKRS